MLKPVQKAPLEVDELWPLLEKGPLLDQVKECLTKRGQENLAQDLLKLEADAAVQISTNKEEFIEMIERGAEQTTALHDAFQIVDRGRMVTVLQQVYDCFRYAGPQDPEGAALRQELKTMMQDMNIPLAPPPPKKQPQLRC